MKPSSEIWGRENARGLIFLSPFFQAVTFFAKPTPFQRWICADLLGASNWTSMKFASALKKLRSLGIFFPFEKWIQSVFSAPAACASVVCKSQHSHSTLFGYFRAKNTDFIKAAVAAAEVRKNAHTTGGRSGCKKDDAEGLGIFTALRKIPRSEQALRNTSNISLLFGTAKLNFFMSTYCKGLFKELLNLAKCFIYSLEYL